MFKNILPLLIVCICAVSCNSANTKEGKELLADSTAALSDADVSSDTAYVPPYAKKGTDTAGTVDVNIAAMEKVDVLLTEFKLKEALDATNEVLAGDSANVYAISRKSIIYTRMSMEADGSQRKQHIQTAGDLAKKAFKLDPKEASSNLAMAVYYGAEANNADMTDKMGFSKLIKKYADRSLQLSPMHPEANYVLGRWYYGLADLGAVKKMMVQKMVKETNAKEPSFEVALEYFRKSLKAEPNNLSYNYFVGAALIKMDKKSEGQPYLDKALKMAPKSKVERELIADAKSLK